MRKKPPNIQTIVRSILNETLSNRSRVEKLERQNLALKIILGVFILVLTAFIYLQISPNKNLTAVQYFVVDEQGLYRAILGPTGLILLDEDMKKRIQLNVNQNGIPALTLYDKQENSKFSLRLNKEGKLDVFMEDMPETLPVNGNHSDLNIELDQ